MPENDANSCQPRRGRKDADGILIAQLAAGATIDKAAEKANISKRTAHRRLEQAAFRQAVTEARAAMISQASGQLAKTSAKAARTLKGLLEAENESVRLQAARVIIESATKLRDAAEFEARLAELDRRIAEQEKNRPERTAI